MLAFFLLATIVAVFQNVLGAAAARALGQHPLMGVLAGSVTMTGGPATGLAFAPLFEQAGVTGPAPKAYLVVPLVGAFFIDFTNALLITFFLNLWR